MTRSKLIKKLASKFPHLTQNDVELTVFSILNCITDRLIQGDRVEIRGFGSFDVTRRAARIARNPKTGEAVAVPAKCVPHFKPGREMKSLVNQ